MHNIKDIRKNLEFYKNKIAQRNSNINFDTLIKLDEKNRELIQQKEKKEQEKKLLSKSKDPSNFELSKKLTSEIDELSTSQDKLHKEIYNILSNIPNIAHEDVPIGVDEKSNKLIYNKGIVRNFDFTIKSHVDIGESNNQIDFRNSSKLSGSRFVILNSNFALLERALINFMLDTHVN